MAHCQRDRYFLLARSHRDEAEQAKKEAADILASLVAKTPQNPDYLYELAETYTMPSRPVRDGKPPEADKKQLQQAVAIGKDLVARYPTVPEYRALLARCLIRLAGSSRSAEALPEAEDALSKAVDLEKKLAVEFASVATYRFSLLRSLHQLAEVQIARHRWPQARASLEEEIAAWTKIQESSPRMWYFRGMLGGAYASLAKVLREMGEKSLADAAAAKAEEAGFHHGPRPFGPFHHERASPPQPK